MVTKKIVLNAESRRYLIIAGRHGENAVTAIEIDCTDYIDHYGEGIPSLVCRNPNEKVPYSVPLIRDGNVVTWIVGIESTGIPGRGHAVLLWYPDDGGEAHTADIEFVIEFSAVHNNAESVIAMIENLKEQIKQIQDNGIDNDAIERIISEYLIEHPIEGITADAVRQMLTEYTKTNDLNAAFANYVNAHKAELKGDKGDKGETGQQGIQGPVGATGATGMTGPKGDKGDTGATGPKGDTGERGEVGQKGDKGDKGDPFTYADFTAEQLEALRGPKGDKGDPGEGGSGTVDESKVNSLIDTKLIPVNAGLSELITVNQTPTEKTKLAVETQEGESVKLVEQSDLDEFKTLIENELNGVEPSSEILVNELTHTTETRAGVRFTWNGDVCTAAGTVTSGSNAMNNLYYSETALPNGVVPKESYYFTYKTTNPHIHLNVRIWTVKRSVTTEYINYGKIITIPHDAVGMQIRLYIPSEYAVNDTISDIHIYKTKSNLMPLKFISVVDDDTTNDTYVTRFHDNCRHNGIVGNYACLTYKLENKETSVEKLLGYEDEGFGMLIHTYYQSGQTDWTDKGSTRNINNCRANLAKGLRQMQEYGFTNFKYWITPGGNKDTEIEELARYFGIKCLVETNNYDWNPTAPMSRYSVKRHGYNPDEGEATAITRAKNVIDAFIADDKGGWLVITTHFNAWSSLTYDETLDATGFANGYSGFNEIIQYAKNLGAKFVPFSTGFSFVEPFCID